MGHQYSDRRGEMERDWAQAGLSREERRLLGVVADTMAQATSVRPADLHWRSDRPDLVYVADVLSRGRRYIVGVTADSRTFLVARPS